MHTNYCNSKETKLSLKFITNSLTVLTSSYRSKIKHNPLSNAPLGNTSVFLKTGTIFMIIYAYSIQFIQINQRIFISFRAFLFMLSDIYLTREK